MNYLKTIYVLWLRQIKRYYRSRARIIGSLGQPILFLVALGYGLGHIFSQAGQGNYIQFLTPGVIGMSIIFTAMFSGAEIIWDRQFGFLKETLVAPVSRVAIMLGRTLGGATVAVGQGLIVFLLATLFGFRPVSIIGIIPAFFFMSLIAILFTALSTAMASRLEDMQGFQLIMNFVVMPIFFLSGAIFPLNNLPPALSVITKANPLSYGIDAMRLYFSGTGHFSPLLDVSVLLAATALFVGLGAWLFNGIEV